MRAPRWRSPRGTAPNRKSRPAAQRLAATEEWRPGRRRATWLPEEEQVTQRPRAEWMKVLRYGHLRSAPVVVDDGVRTEWEPPTLRAATSVSTRPSGRLLDGFLPLQRRANASAGSLQCRTSRCVLCCCKRKKPDPEVRERCRVRRLPFVYSPSGCAGQCGLLFHSYCDTRRFIVFSRPRGLWASMRNPVLSGSPLRADLYTTTIATIWLS